MILRQIVHPATECAAYIFGCAGKKALAVVDLHTEHVARGAHVRVGHLGESVHPKMQPVVRHDGVSEVVE